MAEPPSSDVEHAPKSSVDEVVGRARLAEIQCSREEIKKLKQRVIFLENRVRFLEKQHERQVSRASLLCDAKEVYRTSRTDSQYRKENVLLALKSDVVPACLRWGPGPGNFPEPDCSSWNRWGNRWGLPAELYLDRDILLARFELDDFEASYVNEAYPVDARFRDDKEVMLAVCAKNSHALALASTRLRNDRDVVLAAVQQRFHFAPFALQYASAKLRGDRKIVGAALNREHGIRCFKFLAPQLQNDHRLALSSIVCSSEECSRVYEHLGELPEELRKDYDIVMAAVKKRGSNLRFVADPDLLQDENIIMTACQQDGSLLQFVPKGSDLWKTMLKRENLKIFLAKGNGAGKILQFASPRDQMDKTLVLLAVENGLHDIPYFFFWMYRDNLSLLKRLLQLSGNLYLNLPRALKAKRELGLEALSSECLDAATATEIVYYIPALLEETEPMLCLARHGYCDVLSRCSKEIRDNKEVMVAACSVDSCFWQIASARLQIDPDVVRAALTSSSLNFYFLFKLPKEFFIQNVGMAELAINVCDGDDFEERLYRYLPPEVWRERNVLLALIRKGWKDSEFYRRWYSHPDRLNPHADDDEVLLALIAWRWSQIQYVPRSKRGSRAFMTKVIEVDGRAIVHAVGNLRDFDFMLLAIGSSRKTLQAFQHPRGGSPELIAFAKKVRERLDVADTFTVHFLRGIAVDTTPRKAPRKRCLLPRLDCGYETGAHLKRAIAEFAGVPLGPQVKLLRSASANLEFWGY